MYFFVMYFVFVVTYVHDSVFTHSYSSNLGI